MEGRWFAVSYSATSRSKGPHRWKTDGKHQLGNVTVQVSSAGWKFDSDFEDLLPVPY
jgi:hypothetical protein